MTSTITARTATSVELPVSGLWVIALAGYDDAADPPVVTVTPPTGSVIDAPVLADGICGWRAEVILMLPGRYVARAVTASHGAVDFVAFVTGVVLAAGMPTAADLNAYLESFGGHSWTDDDLDDALTAEESAQRRVCDVPAAYPPDLRQALLRRSWRNLAMRGQPLLVVPGGDDGVTTVAPGADPEVRRLERPFRKVLAR